MYSYTNFQQSPLLSIVCKCGRQFIQQEIYTCLGCCNYACRYCTSIELHTYYCRNCSMIHSENQSSKVTNCNACFSCPRCSHVLSVFKDAKVKKNILLCQFCYWTSKEIGIAQQSTQELQAAVGKASKGIRESDLKLYNHCQRFLKDKILQNSDLKKQHNRKPRLANDTRNLVLQFRADYLGLNPSQTGSTLIPNTVPLLDEDLEYNTLDDEDQENQEDRNLKNIPKGLPLLARKTRRCLYCKKLLTKSFKTFKNQHKVQLGHNQPKVLVCQKVPCVDKVKVKAVVDCRYKSSPQESVQLKNGDIFEVGVDKFIKVDNLEHMIYNFILSVQISIPSKEKKTVQYKFILQI